MLSNIWLPRPRPEANAIPACEASEVACGPAVAIVYTLTLGGPTMYSRKWNTMRVMAMLMRLNQAPSTISRRSERSTGMNNRARNSPSDKLNFTSVSCKESYRATYALFNGKYMSAVDKVSLRRTVEVIREQLTVPGYNPCEL